MGMKKARRPPYPGGEAARARFRHQSLLQDYTELLEETEAKKRRMLLTNQKKLKLIAEVKFLWRRFKCLSENPNQTALYRLKKQPQRVSFSSVRDGHSPDRAIASKVSPQHKSAKGKGDLTSRKLVTIDLNKACMPIGEEMDEFHANQEPIKPDKTKLSTEDGTLAGDVKVSIRLGKRKITWQDQVALKV